MLPLPGNRRVGYSPHQTNLKISKEHQLLQLSLWPIRFFSRRISPGPSLNEHVRIFRGADPHQTQLFVVEGSGIPHTCVLMCAACSDGSHTAKNGRRALLGSYILQEHLHSVVASRSFDMSTRSPRPPFQAQSSAIALHLLWLGMHMSWY